MSTFKYVRVRGKSMAPYFVSNDILLVDTQLTQVHLEKSGSLYLIKSKMEENFLVHRLLETGYFKGDRNKVFDEIDTLKEEILGKVIARLGPQEKIISLDTKIHHFFFPIQSWLSSKNQFPTKRLLSKLIVLGVIIVGKTLRLIENNFIRNTI